MKTIDRIAHRYNLDLSARCPIEIPDMDREDLAELFGWLKFSTGAEIGTEYGIYAETLCKANPELQLICVDPWQTYAEYREHTTQPGLDHMYEATKERLAPYKCTIMKMRSNEAVDSIPDESLDFVYLDGNHNIQFIINDLHAWEKKVRSGGIIAGHDYRKFKLKGGIPNRSHHIIEAVNAYVEAYSIKPWFIIGANAVIEGQKRDKSRSWMWIKE